MKFVEIELPRLRHAGGLFLVVALVTSGLVTASSEFRGRQEDARQDIKNRISEFHRRHDEAIHSRRIIEQYWEDYRLLEQGGLIGEEPRLDWMEIVAGVAAESGVLGVQYRIDARRPYPGAPLQGDYQLYVSPMKVELDLLHEGDFLDFVNNLRRTAGGFVRFDDCQLSRQDEANGGTDLKSHVRAVCTVGWYSVDEPAPPEEPS